MRASEPYPYATGCADALRYTDKLAEHAEPSTPLVILPVVHVAVVAGSTAAYTEPPSPPALEPLAYLTSEPPLQRSSANKQI